VAFELYCTVWLGTGALGEVVIATFGCASATLTDWFREPIRPTLSVTTRLTTNVCAVVKVCAEILIVGEVMSHAILEDREPLRQAEQRRCGEAAVGEVGLERIALCRGHHGARRAAVEEIRQRGRAIAGLAAEYLHVRGHAIDGEPEARHGSNASMSSGKKWKCKKDDDGGFELSHTAIDSARIYEKYLNLST